jgi:hypothetical protein
MSALSHLFYEQLIGLLALLNFGAHGGITVVRVLQHGTGCDHFITGRSGIKQTLLDANTSFRHAGMSFAATSIVQPLPTPIRKSCRFYVSAASCVSKFAFLRQSSVQSNQT